MKILPEVVTFEWDKGNIDKNFKKHKVTNQEAEQIFINELRFILEDALHSKSEKRYMIWGTTNEGRRLSVFFTIRRNKVRIISARDMNKKEEVRYEKVQENS